MMEFSTWSIAALGVALGVVVRGAGRSSRSGAVRASRVLWVMHLQQVARYAAAGSAAAVLHLAAIGSDGIIAARVQAGAVVLAASGIAHTWWVARRSRRDVGEWRGCIVEAGTAAGVDGGVAYETWLVLDAHRARVARVASLAPLTVRGPATARAVWQTVLIRGSLDLGREVAVWIDGRWEPAGPVLAGGMAALSDEERW